MTALSENLPLIKSNLGRLKELKDYHASIFRDNDWNLGSDWREAGRLQKIINFLQLDYDLNIEYYSGGLIIINNKYIVSLSRNIWRVSGKNTWYRHSEDLGKFVQKYILKGGKT